MVKRPSVEQYEVDRIVRLYNDGMHIINIMTALNRSESAVLRIIKENCYERWMKMGASNLGWGKRTPHTKGVRRRGVARAKLPIATPEGIVIEAVDSLVEVENTAIPAPLVEAVVADLKEQRVKAGPIHESVAGLVLLIEEADTALSVEEAQYVRNGERLDSARASINMMQIIVKNGLEQSQVSDDVKTLQSETNGKDIVIHRLEEQIKNLAQQVWRLENSTMGGRVGAGR